METPDFVDINALLAMKWDVDNEGPVFDFLQRLEVLRFGPIGLIFMSCNRDWSDLDDPDDSRVLEIKADYRKLTRAELEVYDYKDDSLKDRSFLCIRIEGGINFFMICENFREEHLSLAETYPLLVPQESSVSR